MKQDFNFARRFNELCDEHGGVTPYKISEEYEGLSRASLYNLRNGAVKTPKMETVIKICDYFDIDLPTFFKDNQETELVIPKSRRAFVMEVCTMPEAEYNRLLGYRDMMKESMRDGN